MVFKRIVVLAFASLMVLTGCQSPPLYNQTNGNVADTIEKQRDAIHDIDSKNKPTPPLLVNQGLYVDKTPISLARDPSWMKTPIIIRGDQLPFAYYSRTILSNGMQKPVLTHYQVGLDQGIKLSLNYKGTVKGALELLAAKSGYVFSINHKDVYWQAFITRTFDIAFMPGATDYLLGDTAGGTASAGGGGGSGGAAASGGGSGGVSTGGFGGLGSSSSLTGKAISVWTDLSATIRPLLSPNGQVVVSQSTTTVTVTDRPSNVALVGKYIAKLNQSLSRQVLVKIQVFEITLNSAFNFGIDWQIIKRGFLGSDFVLNANYGTPVSITPQSKTNLIGAAPFVSAPGGLPQNGIIQSDPTSRYGVNVLVSALEQQGKVSVVSEPRVVALNNQVSVISLVNKEGYAASVSSTALAGGNTGGGSSITSSITPGTLVTGLILYVLPKIMNNKVYLQVNADLSTRISLDTFTSGATGTSQASIQTPRIAEKQINQRSVIGSGDTLILSGFRQVTNQSGAMQLYGAQALGGKAAIQQNTETLILITPIILHGTV
jgi:type IVB pilus formation R64 PilN family outer membrane protein